jgi:hypothetical protein
MTEWLRAKIEPMVTALDGLDPLTMRRAPPTGSWLGLSGGNVAQRPTPPTPVPWPALGPDQSSSVSLIRCGAVDQFAVGMRKPNVSRRIDQQPRVDAP